MKTQFDFNIRKDLLNFIDYVEEREVKRSHRENQIMKGDLKRLAKRLTIPGCLLDTETEDGDWSHFICNIARTLNLVDYDVKGSYAGYSSSEPSFPDNYIEVNTKSVEDYLLLSSLEKEKRIMANMITHDPREFYSRSLLGKPFGRFDITGSGVNVSSKMDYSKVRKRLFEILADYDPGKTIPFGDFINKIKTEEPNLILDRKFRPKFKKTPYGDNRDRNQLYYCFYESKNDRSFDRIEIHESEANGFERVEGRYLAFFLEEIPYLMHCVQIEYNDHYQSDIRPPLPSYIKSFTITGKLQFLIKNNYPELGHVKFTLTPDYKLFVESFLYPDRELRMLEPYTKELSSEQNLTVLSLDRKKTVSNLAENPQLTDVLDILLSLGINVPENIKIELKEWSRSADKLIVYENVALLEMRSKHTKDKEDVLNQLSPYLVDKGTKSFAVIKKAKTVFSILQKMELVPALVSHTNKSISVSGKKSNSKAMPKTSAKALKKVSLEERPFIALHSNDKSFLAKLNKALIEVGIPHVIKDQSSGYILIPEGDRKKIHQAIRKLNKEFDITIR